MLGARVMAAIKLEKRYPISKEKVWTYLVNDELLSSWCMPCNGFALEKGQEFVFEIDANAFFDGTFYNKMTEFEEQNFLVYQCIAKKPALDTIVKWTLTEQDGETILMLEHSGFKRSDFMTKAMLKGGWKKMMNEHLYDKLVNS